MKIAQGIVRKCAGAVYRQHSSAARTLSATNGCALPGAPLFSSTTPITDIIGRKGVAVSLDIRHHHGRPRRLFSSDAKAMLLHILERESEEEENLGRTEMPSELADLKATIEKEWKIVENGATTDMFRTVGKHKIQVSFHCQDTIEDIEEFDDDGNEIDGEEISSSVRFTVTITKTGKTLTFACFSEFGQVKVEGVSTTSTAPEVVHENQGTLAKTEYQGPDYSELAEDLQQALEVYLDEDCGVNSDVAAFIAMFSDYREEMNYVAFLKVAQSIVS